MVKVRLCKVMSILVLLSGFMAACLPQSGHISWQADQEVEVGLSQGQLHPGLVYYYSGPEALPHTIIGVRADLPFKQSFWQPALFGEQQVKEWLAAIDNPHRPVNDMYFGGNLLSRKGEFLGVWFSKYHFYSGYLDSDGNLIVLRPLRYEDKLLLKHKRK